MSVLTVWKTRIVLNDEMRVTLPVGAKVIHVDSQHDQPCIWFLCDPSAPGELRKFLLTGTGHMRDDLGGAKHIGSFQMKGGALVFHLFEVDGRKENPDAK